MKDKYFGDNRDLMKWSVLIQLARDKGIKKIYQIAYFGNTKWPIIQIDGCDPKMPREVTAFFRNINNIRSISVAGIEIEVFGDDFNDDNRVPYHKKVIELIEKEQSPAIIFLDPDTGLEPPSKRSNATHVKETEVKKIWNTPLPAGSYLVLYQHETNKAGKEWIQSKRSQLAKCIKTDPANIKIGRCKELARDVVLFIVQK